MTHRMSAGIGILCFSAFMLLTSTTFNEICLSLEENTGDPFVEQETAFTILDKMVDENETLGYVTNPDDYLFLSNYIFSASSVGVSWDSMSTEELNVIGRFNRTQFYVAPRIIRLYCEGSTVKHVVANFRGQMVEKPPFQMGDLHIRRNFGKGLLLYYNGGRQG